MKKCYSICGKVICIESEVLSGDCREWQLFEVSERAADVFVSCSRMGEFPEELCGSRGDTVSVTVRDGFVYRHFHMGTAQGALTKLNPAEPSKSQTFFTDYSYRTMTDERYLWNSIALSQLLLPMGGLLFHASYIDIGGEAVLFSAPCGTGKSTQAALWQKYRSAEIINGDKAGVSVTDGGVLVHGLPFCGTSGICKNRTLPLKAIVLLRQSPQNTLKRINGVQAVTGLISNIYLDFLADGELQKCVDVLAEILKTVPVYELSCTPDERAVETLEKVF